MGSLTLFSNQILRLDIARWPFLDVDILNHRGMSHQQRFTVPCRAETGAGSKESSEHYKLLSNIEHIDPFISFFLSVTHSLTLLQ